MAVAEDVVRHDVQSLFSSSERDYLVRNNGDRIPVSDLVGNNILLFFSAHSCPPCRDLLPKLIKAYHKIKANDNAFEIIFISSDEDQASFDEFFAEMPWLALPFGDSRKPHLSREFEVHAIPTAVAIGPSGKTVTKKARYLITLDGADAYPFTDERMKELEAKYEEMAKGWPEKLTHASHGHELVLTRRGIYGCYGCGEGGHRWSYYCDGCYCDLHPKCAFEEEGDKDNAKGEENSKNGWVCNGDVCTKA